MSYPATVSAPPDFRCPYEMRCPSVEGWNAVSLKRNYLSQERDLAHARGVVHELNNAVGRLKERCRRLEEEKADLEAQIQALHRRQFKKNLKKPAPGDVEPSAQPPMRKRGAPVGHPGWSRPRPSAFDRTVEVPAPASCPYCRCERLQECDEVREHIQEDIALQARSVATRFRHREAHCPQCGKRVIQWAPGQSGGASIGPAAKSLAMYLRHDIGISVRKAQSILRDLFGLSCAPASLFGFDGQGVARATPLYEDLAAKIRASALVHADETHWRQDGANYYLWFAGNEDLALFRMDRHRSSKAAKALLGENFPGILVSDGYAAYNAVKPQKRQSCLAHLIRHGRDNAKEIEKLPSHERHAASREFCERAAHLFQEACKSAAEFRAGKRDWRSEAQALAIEFENRLDALCHIPPLSYDKAETLRKRLLGNERPQWFAFLRHPETPPTNNLAERALRPIVLRRKTSFGTRSEKGSKNLAVLTSLLRTARLQQKHPLAFLQTLMTRDTPAASQSLYHNTS